MRKFACLLVILIIFSTACSSSIEEEGTEGSSDEISSVNDGRMGDLRELTTDKETLPPFLTDHQDNMKVIYTAVAQHKELLEHMPCYCGCGDSVGHGHNYHCFIHENKDDGSIVWDDHATRCQACLDIAAEAIIQYNDGKSIAEIRDSIDEQYEGKGYPDPTPTERYAS